MACLESLRQAGEPALDVIVVDNRSDDRSPDEIERLHPSVHVIRNEQNLGFAGGNNVGIRAALQRGARSVLLLNNDTVVPRGAIARLLRTLQEDQNAGAVCPLILFAEPRNLVWFAGASFDPRAGRSGRMHGYRRWLGDWVGDRPVEIERGVAAAMLCRREAIEAVGLMDERLFFLYEDVDWSLRFRAAGFRILLDPRCHIEHRVAASQNGVEVTPTTLYYLTRNHLAVCEAHAPMQGVRRARRQVAIVLVHAREALRARRGIDGLRAVVLGWRHYRAGRLGRLPSG